MRHGIKGFAEVQYHCVNAEYSHEEALNKTMSRTMRCRFTIKCLFRDITNFIIIWKAQGVPQ